MATTTADSIGVQQTPKIRTLSTKTIARITGLFYLLIFVTAGFSEGFVRASLIVPGDATATETVEVRGDDRIGRLARSWQPEGPRRDA